MTLIYRDISFEFLISHEYAVFATLLRNVLLRDVLLRKALADGCVAK